MHSSMDKPAQELRPYCTKHKQFFRNWKGADKHRERNTGCTIVSKYLTTR